MKAVPDVVKDIQDAVIQPDPRRPRSAGYTLIVGAGFSYPSIPLTRQIVREEIGEFFYLHDQEMPGARSRSQKERDSIRFWREFNAAAPAAAAVGLNPVGLPSDPASAYRSLFGMRSSNPGFYRSLRDGGDLIEEFLRNILNPGWTELNEAHFLLGCLLELQQFGSQRAYGALVRRIFTTNFDTLLQQALQTVRVLYRISDRPAAGFNPDEFAIKEEEAIHLVYVHGSVLSHNPASTDDELAELRRLNATIVTPWLEEHGVLVVGYGGWDDCMMEALAACRGFRRGLYWCDVHAAEDATRRLPGSVLKLLADRPDQRFYVPLGANGAGQFMAALYGAFAADPTQLGLERRGPEALERHRRARDVCARYTTGGAHN